MLLDATGATGATWDDFRRVYPLSPALLNVLVALSGALQRERTGLKLLQEMLYRRREDMKLGELIPLGDLWDVLADGTGEAFTDRLRREADAAHRFHARVRAHLWSATAARPSREFVADDRFVKTLLLASLAPQLPALARLTGARIAALNLGSIRSRTVEPARMVVTRLQELQAEFGELRSEGDAGPGVHAAPRPTSTWSRCSTPSARRTRWARAGSGSRTSCGRRSGCATPASSSADREFVWRGTRRTAEFVFANVRDQTDVPDLQFTPEMPGNVRFVLDYPFDTRLLARRRRPPGQPAAPGRGRGGDRRVDPAATSPSSARPSSAGCSRSNTCWSATGSRSTPPTCPRDLRLRMRQQLLVLRENLSSQLRAALAQAYGIARPDPGTVRADLDEGMTVQSLHRGFTPRLAGGASFEHNAQVLVDGLFTTLHPRHPDFDPARTGRAITLARPAHDAGLDREGDGDRGAARGRRRQAAPGRAPHRARPGAGRGRRRPAHALGRLAAAHRPAGGRARRDRRPPGRGRAPLDRRGRARPGSTARSATSSSPPTPCWPTGRGCTTASSSAPRTSTGSAPGTRCGRRSCRPPTSSPRPASGRPACSASGCPTCCSRATSAPWPSRPGRRCASWSPRSTRCGGRCRSTRAISDSPRPGRARSPPRPPPTCSPGCRPPATTPRSSGSSRWASHGPSDAVLGTAIVTAPAVLDALDGVEWSLLDSVRALVGHEVVGERAARLVTGVAEAARDDQYTRDLIPVLGDVRGRAVALGSEAARLAAVARPAPLPVPDPEPRPVTPPASTVR